jgi:hypothetical protein
MWLRQVIIKGSFMFKKLVASVCAIIILVIALLVSASVNDVDMSNSTPVLVADDIPELSASDEIFAEYSDGSRVIAAYRVTSNGLVELSKQDYANIISEMQVQREMQLQKTMVMSNPTAA